MFEAERTFEMAEARVSVSSHRAWMQVRRSQQGSALLALKKGEGVWEEFEWWWGFAELPQFTAFSSQVAENAGRSRVAELRKNSGGAG